ncbi:MAG: metallophosphoesterase family protein [Alphaproteobacteria bacterium]|nr:metallophosphoesterase family protein [Alphaproteobacteria bacterium]MDP6517792.1 metallophosphoesterase family protein [Alphaproteobacteria bacterium]
MRNLGRIDGPVLVFGGPYSNLEATRAVLAEARRLAIPAEHVICTGDVAAVCADPRATVDLIRDAGIAVVMGNCEESLGTGGEDCGCGFEEGSECSLMSAQWFAYASGHTDESARAWMRDLPRRIDFRLGGRSLAVIHGAVSSINGFLFESNGEADFVRELDLAGTDGVIGGHSGIPFTRIVDGRLWHNGGVIGVPANDGTPRAWFSVLHGDEDGIRIEPRALDYDHAAAAAKMRAQPLLRAYAEALITGVWPGVDYLPEAEQTRQGQALSLPTVTWRSPALVN